MRNSMSAQSHDSVPPAPAWIVTNAGFLSLPGEQLLELEFFEIAQERIVFGSNFGDGAGLVPGEFLGGKLLSKHLQI